MNLSTRCEVREYGSQDSPHFWHSLKAQGLLRSPLVDSLLEGHTEFYIYFYFIVMIYYSERDIKISQWKKYIGERNLGKCQAWVSVVLPLCSHGQHYLPRNIV